MLLKLYLWGFKFSVDKTKSLLFTRKSITEAQLYMYGLEVEQVKVFRFWVCGLMQS